MNSEPAIADDVIEFIKPYLTAVVSLTRAASQESTIVDSEDKRIKELLVTTIKRDVYENRI